MTERCVFRSLDRSTRRLVGAALAACLGPGLGAGAAPLDFETVALTGDQVPDAAAGVVFSSFKLPVLNASGQTAFFGVLTGTGVTSTNSRGIYSDVSGTLAEVAAQATRPRTRRRASCLATSATSIEVA